jgi:hypothetical protein
MKNKIHILQAIVAVVAVVSMALLWIGSVKAVEYVEETVRDPPTGWDDAPGISFSYVYQYAYYNPENEQYFNIQQSYDWGWLGLGSYFQLHGGSKNTYHPTCHTEVWYLDGTWQKDTEAVIEW